MTIETLMTPLSLGAISMANRLVMAPLTRMRAGPENVPTSLNVRYYAQRATAGLIIAEGTAVSEQARGYPDAPAIYSKAQIAGWRNVTDAVHARGGRIVLQIAHNGRNSHSSFMPGGQPPVAPSALTSNLAAYPSDFRQVPIEVPRALEIGEIPGIVRTFREAALNALEAGFDGVEIQAANGHLIDEFLENGANVRTDAYGGSIPNRVRLLLEIVDAVSAAIGSTRMGVRVSPFGGYGGIDDSEPLALFTHLINLLSSRKIAYLHLVETRAAAAGLEEAPREDALNNLRLFRPSFKGPVISAGGYTPLAALEILASGQADAVAFGRSYIANPDLLRRIVHSQALNPYERATFYGGDARGYTDYPTIDEVQS